MEHSVRITRRRGDAKEMMTDTQLNRSMTGLAHGKKVKSSRHSFSSASSRLRVRFTGMEHTVRITRRRGDAKEMMTECLLVQQTIELTPEPGHEPVFGGIDCPDADSGFASYCCRRFAFGD